MSGRLSVHKHKSRIDAAFSRAASIPSQGETQSDFAKYLCILTAGYIEKSISEILTEHARRCGSPSLQRYIGRNIKKFTNANTEKILQLLGSFDPTWHDTMAKELVDEYKEAIDSVYGLRNTIAHGGSTGLTLARMKDYYKLITKSIETTLDLCIPDP